MSSEFGFRLPPFAACSYKDVFGRYLSCATECLPLGYVLGAQRWENGRGPRHAGVHSPVGKTHSQ